MIIIEIIFTCFSKYSEGDVLQKAIELFEKICCGYYSNKVISSMPATFSLINYPPCNFTNYKMRCSLFFALTELWAADLHNLEQFLNLLRGKIRTCVGKMKETKDLFSEMMGISKALNNEKLFLVMFDVVYHEIWDVVHGLKEFKVDFEMFKIVFRFFTEFSENRSSRIKFEASDPFGIVIFRNLAEMVSVFYGFPDENESNLNTKVKILLRLVNNLLRGGYICFGVFEIYNDPCYLNTIIITFQAILKTTEIQVKLIQRYPKIFLLIFEFFDLLCKNHQKVLLLNSPDYCLVTMLDLFIFTFKTEDLHFSKNNLIIVCGSLIHLFEFSFKVLQKNNLLSNQLMEVLQNVSQKLEKLFEGIFDLILNHDISLMWSVNKVLLLMAILFEENYHKLKTEAISRFSESFEVRHQIEEAFSKLFIGIEKTLDSKNKDQYTKNFGEFKQTMSIL
jgi:exportin-7